MDRDTPCANCGTLLVGEWCHACGQKRFRPEHRRLRHVAGQVFSALTEVDGRLVSTLKGLLLQPGRLAAEYLSGARRRYLAPITVFLLANLVYFIAPPLTDFALSLHDHLTLQPYSGAASELVRERLAQRDLSMAEYAAVFEERQDHLARSLVILHVPLIAIGLAVLHWRLRRPSADHVAVATWLMTYVLASFLAVPFVVALVLSPLGVTQATGVTLWRIALLGVLAVYFFAILRGAYGQPGWLAIVKLPLALAVVVASAMAYRAIIFGTVFVLT